MRLMLSLIVFFALSIIFLTSTAVSEKYEYDNLTVSSGESITFDADELWIQGDILIDGELTIKDTVVNVNRSLDLTISEIRVNSTGKLNLINTTITTVENETFGLTYYALVSDAGDLSIENSQIYYSMVWLVGGNASITNLLLDGYGVSNYGIFSEDTNLVASGVSIRNYTLGLRAIGTSPILNSVFYYNCSTWMTQEWWVTFSPVEETTGLPVSGFEVRQWNTEGNMLGTWNWAKQYEITSDGQMVTHTANFTSYLNLGFAYIEDQWQQQITDNTDMIRTYDMNHHNVSYDSAILFVDGVELTDPTQHVPKWSVINVSILIDNPTDLNFVRPLYTELSINSIVMKSGNLKLQADSSFRFNLTWTASDEGPQSLRVDTVVVDYSANSTEDVIITLSKFVHVEGNSSTTSEYGVWIALLAVFVILSVCSYIIYSGIEDESDSASSEAGGGSEDSDVQDDEHLGEIAIPQDDEEEKED